MQEVIIIKLFLKKMDGDKLNKYLKSKNVFFPQETLN